MTEINSYVDLKWLPVVEKFRHEAKINDDARDAGLNPYPENVDRFDNIRYGDHGDDNLLDLYRPHRHQGKLPVIVHVHGRRFCLWYQRNLSILWTGNGADGFCLYQL